jgi:hypothetical protein
MSSDEKRFYSIEYVDKEGELNIKHGFMTPQESMELLEKFRLYGVTASINQLSHQDQCLSELPTVSFENGRLEGINRGVDD